MMDTKLIQCNCKEHFEKLLWNLQFNLGLSRLEGLGNLNMGVVPYSVIITEINKIREDLQVNENEKGKYIKRI